MTRRGRLFGLASAVAMQEGELHTHPQGRRGTPDGVSESAQVGERLSAREHGEARHPSPRDYVKIGVILAMITAFEVLVYYVDALRDQLVAILLLCMAVKFLMVVRSFMHLKFDNPGYSRVFVRSIPSALCTWTAKYSRKRCAC